jgi:DNA-directed RNA polymerase subunit RPC12/RpoP
MIDLRRGQQFGRLVVLGRAGTRSRFRMWRCRCGGCGSVTEVRGSHLVAGHTAACRYCRHRRFVEAGASTTVDMLGKRYGRLVVVKRAGSAQLHADRRSGQGYICP